MTVMNIQKAVKAIGDNWPYIVGGLMFAQATLDNVHAKTGWRWAQMASEFLSCVPLSGSITGMFTAFAKRKPDAPTTPEVKS